MHESDGLLIGVEEEFLLVDSATGEPAPHISRIIAGATARAGDRAQTELHRSQIELASNPCRTLVELGSELTDLRQKVVAAAAEHGCSVVASGSFPGRMGTSGRLITRKARYEQMAADNAILAREQLICGCHIHITADEPERRVRTMNRMRRWLPCLLALSANSPFWEGEDTGFASYRNEVWSRWPTAGPPGEFASAAEFDHLVAILIKGQVILDDAMAYWDIRPSHRFPTLEIRIADVMPSVEDAVTVAAVARALVATCDALDSPGSPLRPELLKAATWKAAQSGISGELMDPLDGSTRSARETIDAMVDFVGDDLAACGDLYQVRASIDRLFLRGTGSSVQRKVYRDNQNLRDVVSTMTIG